MEGNHSREGPLSMIALTDSIGTVQGSVQNARNLLSEQLQRYSTVIKLKESFGNLISPHNMLKSVSTGGLPLIQLPSMDSFECEDGASGEVACGNNAAGLKEIVVPYFDFAMYTDGSSLLSKIADASLDRPVVGVYQWNNSTTLLRPLPTAGEDTRLPPPSLIFDCHNLTDILLKEQKGLKVAKIGYSGNRIGQLMLLHDDIQGLDVRLCSEKKVSSAFYEAQESLLAASVEELQSSNALIGDGQEGKDDKRTGRGDCWVEVRANLKQPSGFFQRGTARSKHRVAKIPDLPYE